MRARPLARRPLLASPSGSCRRPRRVRRRVDAGLDVRPDAHADRSPRPASPAPRHAGPLRRADRRPRRTAAAAAATVTLKITRPGIAFDTDSLEVPANTPFQIVFTNNDAGIPHNVAIHEDCPTGPAVWTGDIFNGVETRTYDVPALPAGPTASSARSTPT